MPEDFKVEIISPAKIIFKGSANLVTIPSFEGEMGNIKKSYSYCYFFTSRIC